MIWWWVITPITLIVLLWLIAIRSMNKVTSDHRGRQLHTHYLQGGSFHIEHPDQMPFATCLVCGRTFRLGPPPWDLQLAPGRIVKVDSLDYTD